MINEKNLLTHVINLDKYINNFHIQEEYLKALDINPIRFSAINAVNNEHLKSNYKDYISNFAFYFTPKSIIGCALSHILCCKEIQTNFINSINNEKEFFLIMEDDAFPLFDKARFFSLLNDEYKNISILDSKWDIIQLHSDAFFPTYETYNTHFFSGSTAAYLISKNAIMKTINKKIYSHADFIQHNFYSYRKYRTKQNLFYTNENESINRIISNKKHFQYYSIKLKCEIIDKINKKIISIPLRGEKQYNHFLEFKLLSVPFIESDLNANNIIDCILFTVLGRKLYKNYLKLHKNIEIK